MDTTNVREAAVKRAEQIAAIHDFADWLWANPGMPLPQLNLFRHLHHQDGTDAECLDLVRSLAASLGVDTDERLDDRTVLRYRVNGHVWYELFAWHKAGRGAIDEVDRLRARVAELEARGPRVAEPDPTGLAYTRADDDAVDPTQPGPREPLHTGGMTDGGLVDETGGYWSPSVTSVPVADHEPGLIVGDTAAEQRDNAYAAYERDEAEYLPTCPECMGQHHTVEPCR